MSAKEAWDNYVRQRQYYGECILNDEDEGLEIATTFEPLDAAVREVAAAAVAEARAPLVEALVLALQRRCDNRKCSSCEYLHDEQPQEYELLTAYALAAAKETP